MAQDNKRSGGTGRQAKFDDMSDTELIAFIGGDVDPRTNHADLVVMAIEVEDQRQGSR